MFRKTLLAAGAALSLLSQPALAQDEMSAEDPFANMAAMFEAEPLTEEQLARLPLATQIVDKVIPEGAMQDMMGEMFNGMLGPLSEMAQADARSYVSEQLGLYGMDVQLEEAQAQEIANMVDPAWRERRKREADIMPEVMGDMMAVMEGPMRQAMSELYAIHFTQGELVDIDAFFSTSSGAAYARKSFTMASDPRVMAATMEAMPAMMGAIGAMEEKLKAATADLPPVRTFSELSDAEKARISALTGISVEDLEQTVSIGLDSNAAVEAAAQDVEEAMAN